MAGGPALLAGIVIMGVAGLLGSLARAHFDGVLDVHVGAAAPLWFFLLQNPINWLCMAVPLFIVGKHLSTSRVRAVDVFGTQALARIPTLLIVTIAQAPGFTEFVNALPLKISTLSFSPYEVVLLVLLAVETIVYIVWLVTLMYNGYAVSCNLRGVKAALSFAVILVLAEGVSKFVIYRIAGYAIGIR